VARAFWHRRSERFVHRQGASSTSTRPSSTRTGRDAEARNFCNFLAVKTWDGLLATVRPEMSISSRTQTNNSSRAACGRNRRASISSAPTLYPSRQTSRAPWFHISALLVDTKPTTFSKGDDPRCETRLDGRLRSCGPNAQNTHCARRLGPGLAREAEILNRD